MSSPPKDGVYVDEPWLLMRWDPKHSCVHSEWKGFANSAEFRAALMQGLRAVRERQATGYVSDTVKLRVIVREDQQWVNETVIPLMAAAGLKRLAMVTADTGLGKITVEEIVRMVDNKGLLMRTFHSLPDAIRWVGDAGPLSGDIATYSSR